MLTTFLKHARITPIMGGIVFTVVVIFTFLLLQLDAAVVTIDSSVDVTATQHNGSSPSVVFTSEDTGYAFYVDSNGNCVYSKTTDGGDNWGSAVGVDTQSDCIRPAVWYDQWTPGDDTGTFIHVATIDRGTDDLYYTRIDSSNDNQTATINISQGSGYTGTLGNGANQPTITKGTDDTLYAAVLDTSDSIVVECSTTCTTDTNWSENSPTFALGPDWPILVPLLSGDIMLIQWDISANDIESKVLSGGTWDTSWTDIETGAQENTTYDASFGAVTHRTTGDVYLAVTDDANSLGTNDDIKTWLYSGGSWSSTADVVTNSVCAGVSDCGITGAKIAIDEYSDDVYVLYSARSTPGTAGTGNVYYKRSTDSMSSWGTEQGPLDTADGDMYGARVSMFGPRIYSTWINITPDNILGETVMIPTLTVGTTSSQTAIIAIGSTGEHVGGAFTFTHDTSSTTVSSITISETGTVDAQNELDNIELYYEFDTSAPYNCASESYGGGESQFGSTDTDGFSGPNGSSTFTGGFSVSTTSAACIYVVLDVLSSTEHQDTLEIEITTPDSNVSVSPGEAAPATAVALDGTTSLESDVLTQMHYHWRFDDGSESTATSATGGSEDTAIATFPENGDRRIRIQVSNEGSVISSATNYRLEYGELSTTCSAIGTWTDVGSVGGHWDMFDSTNLTDGNDTTNIAVSTGGTTDENTTFETPNGGVKDTSSQTGNITLASTEFVELEYSIQALSGAASGNSYCFRVTDAGTELAAYDIYPEATIAADVLVSVTGTQTATSSIPSTDLYLGGSFSVTEQSGSRNVTEITITETGTIDAENDLDNIRLFYENDTSSPYNCASESYGGGESQFGSTDTDGFSSANGTSTFSGSVGISATSALCIYVVVDVGTGAANSETIDIEISNATVDVIVDGGGSTSPSSPQAVSGSTTLEEALLTQTHFHFRNDDGSESTATSATGGSEDTALTNANKNVTKRLRMQVSNEGLADAAAAIYTLQYAERSTTCSAIGSWTDVDSTSDAIDMSDSFNLTEGANTTNIAVSIGGVTDENSTFIASNGGVRDTSDDTGSITVDSDEFVELEFSIEPTDSASYGATYCFRVVADGSALYAYDQYPELTMAAERDFFVQRGVTTIDSLTVATITAGVDYTAPASNSNAFIRITNTQHTGAGHNVGGGNQNANDVTVVIQDPENLTSSVTFQRFGNANTTRVAWEIVEYIGPPGGDNEIIVRDATDVLFGSSALVASSTVSGISDDNDVVVFVTGSANPDTGRNDYNTGQVTAEWAGASNEAVFTRGESNSDAINVSFAAVEFTGSNWNIQRIEHTYTTAGVEETEPIATVNDLSRVFLHTQKRVANLQGMDEFAHEVWLSSTGAISFQIQSGAGTPANQTSVAWVIENTQTSGTPMNVTRSNGVESGGSEPNTANINIGTTLADLSTASIFTNNRSGGTGTAYPRPMLGVRLISTTQYELWRSDTGQPATYRTEVVEWPTAVRTFTQNYYRFYVDNDALDPTDPWPAGAANLGENTSITGNDEPLNNGDRVRIRMSVTVRGSNLTASSTAFKLQYGERSTSCSAISTWFDVGDTASTTALWRGYDATPSNGAVLSGNPPTASDLNLSVSDRAGHYMEEGNTPGNPYKIFIGEDVEYDWVVENNGAPDQTTYCFRMIDYTSTALDTYSFYPTLATAGFSIVTQNWRWYDDAENEIPASALASENVAPANIGFENEIKLRVTVKETGGAPGSNVKFQLQYSEFSDFSQDVFEVINIGECTPTSRWCYTDGGGDDNATTSATVLTDSDSCSSGVGDGCGTHNEAATTTSTFVQNANAATEFEFAIQHAGADVNRTYFFRLYDVVNDVSVTASSTATYPSLVTEGATLSFSIGGLSSGTVTEGITTDIDTTSTEIAFGSLPIGTELEAAQRLSVTTNATAGYNIFAFSRQGLLSGTSAIDPVSGTNASPLAWSSGCSGSGCYGYHSGDDVLSGSSPRFAPNDTYAQFTTSPEEVAYSEFPIIGDQTDIVYKLEIQDDQEAGHYSANVVYIIVPVF